jgi:hypothetical protein
MRSASWRRCITTTTVCSPTSNGIPCRHVTRSFRSIVALRISFRYLFVYDRYVFAVQNMLPREQLIRALEIELCDTVYEQHCLRADSTHNVGIVLYACSCRVGVDIQVWRHCRNRNTIFR